MDIRRSSLKLFAAKALTSATTYAGLAYFSNVLGQSELGIFFLFEAVLGMLSIVTNLGINGGVEKRVSEQEYPGRVLTTSVVLKLVPLAVVSASVLVFEGQVNQYVGDEVGLLLIVALFLSESAGLVVRLLQGELRVGETAVMRFSNRLTWLLVSAALVALGLGHRSLLYGYVAGLAVMTFWGVVKSNVEPSRPDVETAWSIIDYSKYNFFAFSLAGYVYNWIDVAVIGFFLASADVASYEIAWRVSLVAMLFSDAIASTIFPQISHWGHQNEYDKVRELIRESIVPSLYFVVPIFFGAIAVGEQLLVVVFGAEYGVAWAVLVILLVEKLFRAVYLVLGHSLQALDHPDLAARASVVAVVLNLLLNVAFVPLFGIDGAAVATTTAFVVNTVLHAYYLDRFIDVPIPTTEIAWCVVAGATIVPVVSALGSGLDLWSPVGLSVAIFVGGVSYVTITLIHGSIREQLLLYVRSSVGR